MVQRAIWTWWLAMLAAPVVVLAAGMWVLGPAEAVRWGVGTTFITAATGLWLLTATPAAVLLRSHCFRAAWRGRPVAAPRYLRGMLTVWGVLEAAALAGAAGVVVTGAWLPCALPAATAMMLIAVLWPSARAMEG